MLTSSALVALDTTIIATAVPSIVASLGGFTEFPWLFSIYLLAQAVSVPIYGRLADVWGRKPLLLTGIAVFGAASVLCAAAWSMPVLIVARCLQGLGAGAVQPISNTVVGDLYTLAERARVQAYLASVWVASSVLGPVLGGLLSGYASWRWIFVLNLPLCLLAGMLILRRLHESPRAVRRRVDVVGACLLGSGLALGVLALLEGGSAWPWRSVAGVVVPVLGLGLLAVFVAVEARVAEPLIPLWVLGRRRLASSNAMAACVGAVVLGLSSYVPTYAQTVVGAGPVTAGLALATLLLGWPLAAIPAGRLYLAQGFRRCCAVGTIVVAAGGLVIAALQLDSSIWHVAGGCLLVGIGMGMVATPVLIAAQSSVGWEDRGVVTAMNLFSRALGSALGVAALGALANAAARSVGGSVAEAAAVFAASEQVFHAVAAIGLLMVLIVMAMPPDAPRRRA